MGELTDISKASGNRLLARGLPSREGAGLRRAGRAPLLLVGVLACAAAAGLLVLILLLKTPKGPHGADTQPIEPPASRAAQGPLVQKTPSASAAVADPPRGQADRLPDPEELKKESFEVARQLMVDFPRSSHPIALMGTVHNNWDNTAEAVKWWHKCIQRNPRRADVYHALGMVALKRGEYQEAAELCRKALDINSNMPGVYRGYAEVLLEMGKLDEAVAALEKEIRISPGLSKDYILLGETYLQRQEHQKAVGAYRKALEIQPHDSRPYYGLAAACARLGQGDKAREYMEKFRKLRVEEDKTRLKGRRRSIERPDFAPNILAQILTDAGRMYYGHRYLRKAEEYWIRAAILSPKNTACRLWLVGLYRRTRRIREAVEVCEQLRKIDPKNAGYHLNTGILLAELQRFDAAEEAIRKAIELAPRRASGYRRLVQFLLLRNQKLPEAKALARKLVELEPTARHYSLLGKACSRNQDHAGALAAMKRAAELAPDNAEIQKAYKQPQDRQ